MINRLILVNTSIIFTIFTGEIVRIDPLMKGDVSTPSHLLFDTLLNDTIMKEVWKDIPGYEGIYQISNTGKVKSLHFGKERLLKEGRSKKDYSQVILCYKGKAFGVKVHRLVGIAFINNPENKPEINHKDGNKCNNNVTNIEWVTSLENTKHAFDNRLRTHSWLGKLGKDCDRSKAVLQVTMNGEIIKEFGSQHEASRITGINNRNISNTCTGNRKTAGGYVWKFKTDLVNI